MGSPSMPTLRRTVENYLDRIGVTHNVKILMLVFFASSLVLIIADKIREL